VEHVKSNSLPLDYQSNTLTKRANIPIFFTLQR